ncbi:MAG: hypothetical protein PCFJNLEI_03710 [Verrucomicrobiae bacterium]|nr:hypothetical protein [Verrucomicrobiae bacterium]
MSRSETTIGQPPPRGPVRSIRTQVQRMVILTTVIALAVACVLIIAYQYVNYRRTIVARTHALAEMIGVNSAAVLRSQDADAARELLRTCAKNPEILSARLHTPGGDVFAEYVRPGGVVAPFPLGVLPEGYVMEGSQLILRHAIMEEGQLLGVVGVRADMRAEVRYFQLSTVLVLVCMVLAALVASVVARWFQGEILEPVVELASVADKVVQTSDYSLRATTASRNEIGALAGTFNNMLKQIQERDKEVSEAYDELAKTTGQLQVSEEQFRQLAENINEVFWLTNHDKSQLIYVSPAYATVWGRSCASLLAEPRSWADGIHPEDRDRVAAAMPAQVAGEYDVEYRIRRPDGSERWIHDRAFPIRDAEGQVYRIAGIAADVTDRKEAELALQIVNTELEKRVRERTAELADAEQRMRLATEATAVGIWEWNLTTNRIRWDAQMFRNYGMTPTATGFVEYTEWSTAVLPEELAQQEALLQDTVRRKGHGTREFRIRRRNDGQVRIFQAVETVRTDAHGQVEWVVGTNLDITERREAEEQIRQMNAALRDSEGRLRLALAASKAGVWSWDAGTNDSQWDEQYRALYGFAPAGPIAVEVWFERIHPDDRDRIMKAHYALVERGTATAWNEEFRIVHPTRGVRWVTELGRMDRDSVGEVVRTAGIAFDITERKEAEEQIRQLNAELEQRVLDRTAQLAAVNSALRAQQQEQQTILDSVPSFIWYKDCHNRILRINQSAATAIGKTVAEVEGRPTAEFYPDEAELYYAADQEVIRSGQPKLGIVEPVTVAAGEKRWVQTDKVPFRNDRGEIIGIIVCATDITTLRHIEIALRETETRLNQTIQAGNIGMWDLDLKTQQVFYSDRWKSQLGYADHEVANEFSEWESRLHPDDRGPILQVIRDYYTAPTETAKLEFRLRHKDGSYRWILSQSSLFRDAAGNPQRLLGTHVDITSIKEAELNLRLQAAVIQNMAGGVVMARLADARIIYVNPTFERKYGYATGELNGQLVRVLNAGTEAEAATVEQESFAALKKDGFWSGEIHNRRKDGTTFWCHATASTFEHAEHGVVCVSVQEDVTEQKRVQDALRQAEAQYRHLVESVPAVTYTCELGAAGRWHFVSPQLEPLLGFTPAEWLADPQLWHRQVVPEDRELALFHDAAASRTGRFDAEYRMLTRTGRTIWVRDTGLLLQGTNDSPPLLQGILHEITTRKEAELALRESEERYRQLIEQAPECIGVAVAGKLAFINSQGAKLLGVDNPAAVLGRPVAEFVHPDDLGLLQKRIRQLLKTHGPAPLEEYTLRRVDGTMVQVEATATFVTYQGAPAVQAVIRDVSARRAAEVALRESEENYRRLVNALQEGLCASDANAVMTFVNPQFAAMVGYQREELVGQSLFMVLDAAGTARVQEQLARRRQGHSDEYEHEVIHKSGRRIQVMVRAVPLLDGQGRYLGALASLTDITERKLAEKAARESREQLQVILDNSPAVIYLKDPAGKYLLINRQYELLFHVKLADVMGKTDCDLFPANVAEEMRKNDQRVLTEKQALQVEEVVPLGKEMHTYVSVKFPICDAAGVPVAIGGISTDISDRQRLQRQLLEVSDREQRRIGRDLHDGLCQLLTGTAFAAKALEERLAAAGVAEVKDVSKILDFVQRANVQARNVARGLYPVELQVGGLVVALRELVAGVHQIYRVDCQLECDPECALPDSAKAVHLYRIAQEAVTNAVKHGQAKQIVVRLAQADGTVALSVVDDGRGLPAAGPAPTGMGMTIMAYRARMLGGTLSVTRRAGGGTIVELVCALEQ